MKSLLSTLPPVKSSPIQRFNPFLTIQRVLLFALWPLAFSLQPLFAATVTGNLTDISIQALNTKLMFWPTTNVLVTPSGLSAGPPKVIDTANGGFSLTLEAGDYTVSLPLIPWRRPFNISVFSTNGTVNITNLLTNPQSYTYTNNLNYLLKSIATDATPDFLDAKLNVAGSLSKLLMTNSGAVSVTLSNHVPAALHVNAAQVMAWSTNAASSLLDSTTTISAGALAARNAITIEAFSTIADPGVNGPSVSINLKLGSTTLCTQAKASSAGSWYFRGLISVRSTGVSGSVAASMSMMQDNGNIFPFDSNVTTVNTTGSLTVDLTASLDNFTGAEAVICEQAVVKLE